MAAWYDMLLAALMAPDIRDACLYSILPDYMVRLAVKEPARFICLP